MLHVDGLPTSMYAIANTVLLTAQIGEAGTASFQAYDPTGEALYCGTKIWIEDEGNDRRFVGYVYTAQRIDNGTPGTFYEVQAVSRMYDAQRRYIATGLVSGNARAAVLWIYDTYLDPEGIGLGSRPDIDDETAIESQVLDGLSVAEALNTVCNAAGWQWVISAYGNLMFGPAGGSMWGHSVSGRVVGEAQTLADYANRVTTIGGYKVEMNSTTSQEYMAGIDGTTGIVEAVLSSSVAMTEIAAYEEAKAKLLSVGSVLRITLVELDSNHPHIGYRSTVDGKTGIWGAHEVDDTD